MKNDFKLTDYQIPPRAGKARPFRLEKWATDVGPLYADKGDYRSQLRDNVDRIAERQRVLYAHNRYALLLIFQGMDTSGKDGAIRHVLSGVNPQGVSVESFKQPSEEELNHDFLWRTTCRLPERGHIGVFNRSFYEEVLIVRAEPKVLAAQRLPEESRNRPDLWEERYRDIVQFEDYLVRNGTRVVKFFLHLSKTEQRRRFMQRIDKPDKNWKFSTADLDGHGLWDRYQKVYEQCLAATSHAAAPWYCVPADDKRNARLVISAIVAHTLEQLPLQYPKVTPAQKMILQEAKAKLEKGLEGRRERKGVK
jgi:PPK2 family polyphosphate:nucleotide phosphotransferase